MKMKRIAVWLLFVLALSGCGQMGRGEEKQQTKEEDNRPVYESFQAEESTDDMQKPAKLKEEKVVPTEKIQELEKGLSAVQYKGDYGFENFLANGGASSDGEVLDFLTNNLMSKSDTRGLLFESEMFGCSTISVKNMGDGYLFGRNFDWMACDAMVVASYPENGYASISTVNMDFIRQGTGLASLFLSDDVLALAALYAPLDGMNEKGLCISVNMIQDGSDIDQNTDKTDITTTTAIRLLLDKAATVEEAVELLKSYDLHASMNYMVHFAIADAAGNSAAVEYIENEMQVIETPVLTNFYLSEGEKQGIGTEQSHIRYEALEKALSRSEEMDAAMVRDVLDSVSKDNYGSGESTEWSIIFDQNALTAHYYHRENYESGYLFNLK